MIIHPVLISGLFTIFKLEYFWYLSENYKMYDLLYAFVSFVLFAIGLKIWFKKNTGVFLFVIAIIIVSYQYIGINLGSNRFSENLKLNQSFNLLLVRFDPGAFSSGSFVKLVLMEKKYFLFVRRKVIDQYNNISKGELKFQDNNKDNELISIQLTTYSKEKKYKSIFVRELIE